MGDLRERHLPAEGSQGRRLSAGTDARGAVHAAREGPLLLVQGPAPGDLPDPGQVPRRGASAGRPAARTRVHDEGRLLLRLHRRRARCLVPAQRDAYERIFHASRPRVRHRRRPTTAPWAVRAARSSCTPPRRRRHLRALGRRLRRERGGVHDRRARCRSRSTACRDRSSSTRPNTPTIATLVAHANAHLDAAAPRGSGRLRTRSRTSCSRSRTSTARANW